ncbi:winged helix-turn-helix domain-containing protein [Streptomyces sp. NPDC037389]|uniref:GntR family transcriptional regulator n=1 Tax=Streptomyces sp. NPDC037389 TaxID=3155369 RepID=UPI0033C129ED
MEERAIDRRSPTYLYMQIAEDIIRDIKAGKLEVNRPVPSAPDLVKRHGVALATAQKALRHLVEEGYAYTVPKRGTYVKACGTADE